MMGWSGKQEGEDSFRGEEDERVRAGGWMHYEEWRVAAAW